jgi:hypothetical protein
MPARRSNVADWRVSLESVDRGRQVFAHGSVETVDVWGRGTGDLDAPPLDGAQRGSARSMSSQIVWPRAAASGASRTAAPSSGAVGPWSIGTLSRNTVNGSPSGRAASGSPLSELPARQTGLHCGSLRPRMARSEMAWIHGLYGPGALPCHMTSGVTPGPMMIARYSVPLPAGWLPCG